MFCPSCRSCPTLWTGLSAERRKLMMLCRGWSASSGLSSQLLPLSPSPRTGPHQFVWSCVVPQHGTKKATDHHRLTKHLQMTVDANGAQFPRSVGFVSFCGVSPYSDWSSLPSSCWPRGLKVLIFSTSTPSMGEGCRRGLFLPSPRSWRVQLHMVWFMFTGTEKNGSFLKKSVCSAWWDTTLYFIRKSRAKCLKCAEVSAPAKNQECQHLYYCHLTL